jgi:hypothetical protein
MKKAVGNMFGFVTHTWNAIKGKCGYRCSYCYVSRWGSLSDIRLDTVELNRNLGENKNIFICSGCDIFNPRIYDEWIESVIDHALHYKNKYLLHTKNPERVLFWEKNIKQGSFILGTTIESNRFYKEITGGAPEPWKRFESVKKFGGSKMITITPVLDFDLNEFSDLILESNPVQVNLGADTGNNHLPEPKPSKIRDLINILKSNDITIHLEKNLKRLLMGDYQRKLILS